MNIIANSALYNPREYGRVSEGERFTVRDSLAQQLIAGGQARPADPPRILYETKVITPAAPQVSAREPFRYVPLPDPEPAAVAAESDRVLSGADVPAPRTADRGKRRKAKSE